MENSSVIVVTELEAPRKPPIWRSIPTKAEKVLVYRGGGFMGRCKNLGANQSHRPILIFMDDDVEFKTEILQKQVDRVKARPDSIITLGWRQWEVPRALVIHRETFDQIEFDPDLFLLESMDLLLRAHEKGFQVDTQPSPYDGHPRAFFDVRNAWFWYQFNQVAFIMKHKHIPRNAFDLSQKNKIDIKPLLFFFNPRTVKGIPTPYKSRRVLIRWIAALYYGAKKLLT